MGLTSGDAIVWTAEAQGDRTVVARHPDGHRIVFGFSAEPNLKVSLEAEPSLKAPASFKVEPPDDGWCGMSEGADFGDGTFLPVVDLTGAGLAGSPS